MKRIYLIFALLLASQLYAQQDPQYTQYMYNMNVINPAYAGSSEDLSIGLLYRSQWVGIDGAPETFTAAVSSPVGERVGLGLSVISDQIGPVRETNAYADFSYTLPLGNDLRLALGLKAGATFHDIGLEGLAAIDDNDPFLANDINEVTPNVGAGAYFYKPNKFYVSLSMPNILNATHLDADGYNIGSETQHFFGAAGYVFTLSDNFKLKPHGMIKWAFDSPVSFDVNANLFMYDLVEIGAGYRLDDSFVGMVNFLINDSLRVGYAYDNIQSELNIAAPASHEVFITYDLNFSKRVSRSPRYF
ncbi:PorP/SprF family type IX secretion system membrane protein [Mangrovimonas aestuarii]|uniref:PorP/SprF family type IX secretion system membrane protein n=1 Tax=Mangrovimonas aestuarii TaxID=3018443 RepID=UPI002379B137|nr:type IX secretion system membrane protein PorP/SprF [Mangrovimonas aestuarii]